MEKMSICTSKGLWLTELINL